MIVRALLALVLATSGSLLAAGSPTYQRSENFATIPSNWRQAFSTQFFGFDPTQITGGPGAAGGFLVPNNRLSWYSDRFLNGALYRGDVISARGRLVISRASSTPLYTGTAYIGHFGRPVNGVIIDTVGIALVGQSSTQLSAVGIVQFSNGRAYIGREIAVEVNSQKVLRWSYTWNPNGGERGGGQLVVTIDDVSSELDLGSSSLGTDFALNTFGLYQPPLPDADPNSFVQFYAGNLRYTARPGRAPVVRTQSALTTTTNVLPLSGTARVNRGNRVSSVRYRVIKGGTATGYRRAQGTTNWSANVRLNPGESTVEIVATSDAGRQTRIKRTVTSAP